MSYMFEQKFGISQAHFARIRMIDAVKKGQSFNSYQRSQITAGTGYKRLDMLKDWNRAKVVERSKRAVPRARLVKYYDEVAMPVMEKMKITPTTYFKAIRWDFDIGDMDSEEYIEWLRQMMEEEKYQDELYAAAF